MLAINTPLTKRLKLKTPIISAPMPGAATPELTAAVSGAGALGGLGAGYFPTQVLKAQIQQIRTILKIADGEPVPIVLGFLGWILDRTETSDDPRLLALLDEKPTAVWFAFGDDLEKYVAQVHAHGERTGRKTFIFVIIHSVEDARRAALNGVDAVVVQGVEAGGHGGAGSPPLFVLLQAVLREISPGGPLVIAAGGIATGTQIAALLAMGADGVALGTRFLFTPECGYTPEKKDLLINADLSATVRGLAFDEVGRTMGWPAAIDGRAITNDIIADCEAGLSLEERLARFDESARKGETSRLVVWAGVGAGLTKEIMGAADVVRELHTETVERLRRSAGLLNLE